MAERDAFGREVGEDPLASLGWSTGAERPPADQVDTARRAFAVPGEPKRRRATRVRGPSHPVRALLAVVVAVGAIGGIGAAAVSFVGELGDEIDSPGLRRAAPAPGSPAVATPGEAPDSLEPPVGVRRGSLLLRVNFTKALTTLRSKKLGSVHSLRVAPERIDAQLKTAGGRLRNVQIRSDGGFRQLSVSGPGFGSLPTVPFARIAGAAPFRLVARAARRLRRGADAINYLVLSAPLGTQQWGAYFKSGAIFLADGRGKITRRIS